MLVNQNCNPHIGDFTWKANSNLEMPGFEKGGKPLQAFSRYHEQPNLIILSVECQRRKKLAVHSSSKMVVRENLGKKPGHQQLFPWQKIMKHWPTWIDWMQLTNFANLILSMNIFSFICLQYEDSPYILAYSFIDDSSDNLVLNQTSIIIWVIRL